MNINQVKYFVAAYEQGSISTAARLQNVTAQAVSKAIADLEREYGDKLFERTNHGVKPTMFGRAFYQKARQAAKAYAELESLAATDRTSTIESLKPFRMALCAPAFDGDDRMRDAWSTFLARNTDMPVEFDLATRDQMINGIGPDDYDALITIGTYEAPGCTCTPVGTLPCGITISRTHPLAAKEFVTFADLAEFPAGQSQAYDSFNDSILITFKKRGLVTNIKRISTAPEALSHLMLNKGYYFSVVISQLAKPKLTTVLRPLDPAEDPRIPICFVTRDDRRGARHRIVQNFLLHAMDLVGGKPQA